MNMKSRRLRRGVASIAVLAALTACAKENDKKEAPAPASASPTPSGTPTTTPDLVQAFCNALVGLDTARVSLGPPEEPEPTATPTSASASAESESTASPAATATSDSASASVETAEPTSTGAPAGGPPSFPSVAEAMGPAADRLAAAKTREIAGAADTMVALLREAVASGDRELLEGERYNMADAALDAYGLENCDYKAITTKAVEHEYDGLPKTATAGKTTITLENEGEEFHEVVLLRINEGVTDSVDDLVKLPQDELLSKVTLSFVTVAPPGRTGTGFTDLRPGKYIALCFFPKGAKPGVEPDRDAPPHFAEGMIAELVVS